MTALNIEKEKQEIWKRIYTVRKTLDEIERKLRERQKRNGRWERKIKIRRYGKEVENERR